MRQRGRGGIIFVASTLSFAAVPAMSNYAASKAQALVFAEGLAKELRNDGISVLALCPGPTRTELWPAGSDPGPAMPPRAVVDTALKKLGRKTTVVAGWKNSLTALATRLLPRSRNATIVGRAVGGTIRGVKPPTLVQPEQPHTTAFNQGQ